MSKHVHKTHGDDVGVRKNFRDYKWQNEGVFSDDIPRMVDFFMTLSKEEVDAMLLELDKANKTGSVVNNNICLLNEDGDLEDSGFQISDFGTTVLDGSEFSDTSDSN